MSETAAFRRRWRLGQNEMASRLGVHRVTLAKWDTGARPEPPWLRLALAGLDIELRQELDEGEKG